MPKTIMIVGANRGIGLELAKQYIARGEKVIATCRKASAALESMQCIIYEDIDVSNDTCFETLAHDEELENIDILIHNSGILNSDRFPDIELDNMRQHFEVNSLGPLKSVMALKHKLKQGSKVGIVSSRVGSIEDNSSSNNYAYRVSKTAVNMIGKCLSIDLADEGISLALLHPGYVKTDMTHQNGLINADESAAGIIARMDELSMRNTGSFLHSSGEVLTW